MLLGCSNTRTAITLFSFVRVAKFFRRANELPEDSDNPMGYGGPLDFLLNVGAIVYVEMALKWNNISGVHSLVTPGQFMPFFISLAQLLSVFYGVAKVGFSLAADDASLSDSGDGKASPDICALISAE